MDDLKTLLFSAKGRIRRSQYWLCSLGVGAVWMFCLILVLIASGVDLNDPNGGANLIAYTVTFEYVSLPVIIWINVCLTSKRWHDRDKSGWMTLISVIPIVSLIGGIWTLVECGFLDGTQGPNQYGPSPKSIGHAEHVF